MDIGLDFERMLTGAFGQEAYQTASQEASPRTRRTWLIKTFRFISERIDGMDTPDQHKALLLDEVDSAAQSLTLNGTPSWGTIYRLVALSVKLLGVAGGTSYFTPSYWRSSAQYYQQQLREGGYEEASQSDRNNAVAIRYALVQQLKSAGHDDFKIGLIMNMSESSVKKLRSSLAVGTESRPAHRRPRRSKR